MSRNQPQKQKNKLQTGQPSLQTVPPNSKDLELAVLGAIVASPDVLDEITLTPEDFYSLPHQIIFQHILKLQSKNIAPDLVMLMESLEATKEIEKVGGPVALGKLIEVNAAPSMAVNYAAELKDLSRRRTIIQAGWTLAASGPDRSTPVDELAGQVQQAIDQAMDCEQRSGQRPEDATRDWIANLEKLEQQSGGCVPVPFAGLEKIITGLFPGEICIVAARPSNGKTALVLNMLEWALIKDVPSAIFSLEMNNSLLINRMAAARMNIDATKFRTGKLDREDWGKIREYESIMNNYPARLWDRPTLKPRQLWAQCRKWKREIGLKMAIVDYLQLMDPDVRGSSREREIAEISRTLKQIAGDLDLSMVLACQLNREADKSKKPLLSHLRESGAVEQDADTVMFITPWDLISDSGVVEINIDVAKGRNSATGRFPLLYHRNRLLFADPANEY